MAATQLGTLNQQAKGRAQMAKEVCMETRNIIAELESEEMARRFEIDVTGSNKNMDIGSSTTSCIRVYSTCLQVLIDYLERNQDPFKTILQKVKLGFLNLMNNSQQAQLSKNSDLADTRHFNTMNMSLDAESKVFITSKH